jgi:L-alanine-DL-glutamate epimerase-like enolase superfamily enzyme
VITTLVLVDGEHYPPTTRWALHTARAEGYDVVACLFVGGTEKVGAGEMPDLGPVPVERAGLDLAASIRDAIRRYRPAAVLDVSDEPVLGYRERALVAAAALAEGVRYVGADFALEPPIEGPPLDVPAMAVIGTGKRTGKTAVAGEAARSAARAGLSPVVVAMGRGGPPEPQVAEPGAVTLERLLTLVEEGQHAASDYLEDALTRAEALELLRAAVPQRAEREARLLATGYPAYATTPGWLGYDDEKLVRLSREAVQNGFSLIKVKVGARRADDERRLARLREAVGPGPRIAIDANQAWSVDEAIAWVGALREHDLYWIEEPTAPDDVLGHAAIRRAVAPVRVATGEHAHNRILFKQLLAAQAVDVVQIDACRVAGVNENIAILLLAAKFGVPVCPHAGGVGLCEMVQHLAMFDYVALSGTQDGRFIEFVDHLHEHFEAPVVVRRGRYVAPTEPGAGARMQPASVEEFAFPDGRAWTWGGSPAADAIR